MSEKTSIEKFKEMLSEYSELELHNFEIPEKKAGLGFRRYECEDELFSQKSFESLELRSSLKECFLEKSEIVLLPCFKKNYEDIAKSLTKFFPSEDNALSIDPKLAASLREYFDYALLPDYFKVWVDAECDQENALPRSDLLDIAKQAAEAASIYSVDELRQQLEDWDARDSSRKLILELAIESKEF